jgi:hypothetical protein
VTTPWRRDAHPARICTCDHAQDFHRVDLKSQPCGSCTCKTFTLAALQWREHRTVTEEVQPRRWREHRTVTEEVQPRRQRAEEHGHAGYDCTAVDWCDGSRRVPVYDVPCPTCAAHAGEPCWGDGRLLTVGESHDQRAQHALDETGEEAS